MIESIESIVSQTSIFLQVPGKSTATISEKLAAYDSLIKGVVTLSPVIQMPSIDSSNANLFYTRDVFASTLIAGAITSVINATFETKPEALGAAERLLSLFETVQNWRDLNFESLGAIDTGQAYQQLQNAVSLAAGFLVEISFSLKQERTIVLDRKRTIIDLAAELYGSVDDQLDFLINSNNLSGSEIIELPEGRLVKYYV